MNYKKYAILGIHDESVLTVEGNVARVRMFVGDTVVDEDFPLPDLLPGMPKSSEVYELLLKDTIETRVTELEAQNV